MLLHGRRHCLGGDKPKKRDIGNGAKETITKLIKSTRRALNPGKETVESVVAAT